MEKTRIIVSDVYLLDLNSREETRIFDELVIGREECDLEFPQDTLISRRHLRLTPANDVVLLEDLGSTNNTWLNGKKLKPNVKYKLRSRDVIQFGNQKCQIIIGGKIADDRTQVRPISGVEGDESMVMSRLIASTEESAGRKKVGGRELDGMEDFSAMDTVPTFEESEVELARLVNTPGVGWYLQFNGSEFGPLNFNEMKVIVNSERFQGGELYVWAEGLPTWTLITSKHKIFHIPNIDLPNNNVEVGPTPLVAMVSIFATSDGNPKKISATCQSISLHEVSIVCPEKLDDSMPLEIEVSPRGGLGLEKFRLTVQVDSSRTGKKSYVLTILTMPPKSKTIVERHIRAYQAELKKESE